MEQVDYFLNSIVLSAFLIIMTIFVVLMFYLAERLQRIGDRYRLKYGFDRDIEKKEISGKEESYEEKLNSRERRFKKRTFKD